MKYSKAQINSFCDTALKAKLEAQELEKTVVTLRIAAHKTALHKVLNLKPQFNTVHYLDAILNNFISLGLTDTELYTKLEEKKLSLSISSELSE